ncbi:hypothetical protein [Azospirillum palustre]
MRRSGAHGGPASFVACNRPMHALSVGSRRCSGLCYSDPSHGFGSLPRSEIDASAQTRAVQRQEGN